MRSPIEHLVSRLSEGTLPTFDWMVEHAPDGTLAQIWDDSEYGSEMLWLYAFTGDTPNLVRAAVACVRHVGFTRLTAPKYVEAIESVEQWSKGRLTRADLIAARDANWMYRGSAPFMMALDDDPSTRGQAAMSVVGYAFDGQIDALGEDPEFFWDVKQRELAGLVRSLLPCPTLEQVMPRE